MAAVQHEGDTVLSTTTVAESFTEPEPCPDGHHEMVFQFGEGGRKCGGGTYETFRCARCGETGHA